MEFSASIFTKNLIVFLLELSIPFYRFHLRKNARESLVGTKVSHYNESCSLGGMELMEFEMEFGIFNSACNAMMRMQQ